MKMVLSLVDMLLCTESLISSTVPSPQKAAGSGFAAVPKAYQDNVIPYVDRYIYILLGKLEYFTNLNLAASYGDDSPYSNYGFLVRENRVRS